MCRSPTRDSRCDNAELALRDAELALDRRSIIAPIAGVVGILPVEAGNYVDQDDGGRDHRRPVEILVDFWVPERYATLMNVGASLKAAPVARPAGDLSTARSAPSTTASTSRAGRCGCRPASPIPNDTLRAGMSFQVTMKFPGDTYPAVDPLAIQWGIDGAFVWVVRDGKAKRTPVRIVQRNTDTCWSMPTWPGRDGGHRRRAERARGARCGRRTPGGRAVAVQTAAPTT
jgi:multidrug efflux pump subunit AcrA (membrane-fusion protein)